MPALLLLIGGAIAAALGYFSADYRNSLAADDGSMTRAELTAALQEQTARADALEGQIAEVAGTDIAGIVAGAIAPVTDQIAGVTDRIDTMSTKMAALEDRVETIAMRPVATGMEPEQFDEALTQFRDELAAAIDEAQSEIVEARTEAAEISESAFEAERTAVLLGAWSQVEAAIRNGSPFAEALGEVQNAVEVPEVLVANAEDGVPTLAALQEAFPAAARTALDASIRATTAETDSPVDRLGAFLRVQTGVRSLEPREGSDPDAVLSRAEAAVRAGDLGAALDEITALPDPGQAALADWAATAQTRADALGAMADVADMLTTN